MQNLLYISSYRQSPWVKMMSCRAKSVIISFLKGTYLGVMEIDDGLGGLVAERRYITCILITRTLLTVIISIRYSSTAVHRQVGYLIIYAILTATSKIESFAKLNVENSSVGLRYTTATDGVYICHNSLQWLSNHIHQSIEYLGPSLLE